MAESFSLLFCDLAGAVDSYQEAILQNNSL